MQRLLAIGALIVALTCPALAFWQSRDSNYNVAIAGGAAYSGPGDVVSSAIAWWGLRAYSAAKAGNKAVRLVRASDSTQQDINTLANGNLDVSSASTFCNATTCKVVTLYDQTGNTNCTSACDITQATDANRPAFTFNCIGSLPCITNVTGNILTSAGLGSPTSQPFTFSWIAERTASTSSFSAALLTGQIFNGFANSPNLADMFAGSHVTATANDSVIHAVQGTYNGASSVMYVDGSSTNVSPGTATTSVAFHYGGDTFGDDLNGIYFEGGFWASQFNATQAGNMNTNQHSYWGF